MMTTVACHKRGPPRGIAGGRRMRVFGLLLWALLLSVVIVLAGGCGRQGAEAPPGGSCLEATSKEQAEWRTFRNNYPYHYQTIAVSPTFSDRCRIVIISEPAPSADPVRIRQLLSAAELTRMR